MGEMMYLLMDDKDNCVSQWPQRNIITNSYLTIHQETYKLLLITFYERIAKSCWYQKLSGLGITVIGIGVSGIIDWIASALIPYIRNSQFIIKDTLSKLYAYIGVLMLGVILLSIGSGIAMKEREKRKSRIIDDCLNQTLESSSNIQNQSEFIDITHDSKEIKPKYIDIDLTTHSDDKG